MHEADEILEKENTQGYSLQNERLPNPKGSSWPGSFSLITPGLTAERGGGLGFHQSSFVVLWNLTDSSMGSITRRSAAATLLPCPLRKLLSTPWVMSCWRYFTTWEQLLKHLPQADSGSFPRMSINFKALSEQKAGQNAESDDRDSWGYKCKVFKIGALSVLCVPVSKKNFQRRTSVIILSAIMDLVLTLLVQIYKGILLNLLHCM